LGAKPPLLFVVIFEPNHVYFLWLFESQTTSMFMVIWEQNNFYFYCYLTAKQHVFHCYSVQSDIDFHCCMEP